MYQELGALANYGRHDARVTIAC